VGYLFGFVVLFVVLASLGVSITQTRKNKQIASVVAFVIAAAIVLTFYNKIH